MDHSEQRRRDWTSQQDFESFMRQNDPNRRRNSETRGVRTPRASETSVPRPEMGSSSPYANVGSMRRRNTFDPSMNMNHLRVPSTVMQSVPSDLTQSPISMSRTPSSRRRSPRGRPKAPPLPDDDLDNDLDDLMLSDASDEESSDQKPAARMQEEPGYIEAPETGSPFASMVRNHRESTAGGGASSYPRNQDRWHSGGAPTRTPNDIHRELPTPTAIPPPKPNYTPLEPSVPHSRLGRRCLIDKPKREADLVKGLAVVGADGSIRSRDTIVVNCAKCGADLSMPRSAIVVSCPSCYKISPAASCKTAGMVDD